MRRRPVYLVAAACMAEIFSMAGVATFAALLPIFQDQWQLSNTQAGWINAIYFAGYLLAVLILVSLTDRIDPRLIYMFSMALTIAATAGFALFADGFWTALAMRSLAGIGLAGTYMPGLKMLSDIIEGPAQSRAVAFYTSSFGLGTSMSYYLSGILEGMYGWRITFQLAAAGPALALVMVLLLLPAAPPKHKEAGPALSLGNFMRVLRNKGAMGYVLAYTVHNFELFGFRSWIVTFLTFLQRRRPPGYLPFSPTTMAALANLMAVPASILGNEAATRFGRRQTAATIMFLSALTAYGMGFVGELPGLAVTAAVVFYGWTITGESSTVTAGTVAEAEEAVRGMTMAVHSSIGFLGSFLGPLVFGVMLDVSGGGETLGSWGLAFATMGLAVALGPLMLLPLTRGAKTDTSGAQAETRAQTAGD